ncbi:MAG: HAD family hydrolase [Phycisphaerales bacterium]|nr:HAD family hydrolase [Phycisphaerales bacterium]
MSGSHDHRPRHSGSGGKGALEDREGQDREGQDRFGWRLANPDLVSAAAAGLLLTIGFFASHWWAWPRPMVESLYIASCMVGGWRVTMASLRQVLDFTLDVDLLMLVAAIGACVIGRYSDGALLLVLFSLGHGLEELATSRARRAIEALGHLAPRTARLIRGTQEVEIAVDRLAVGDVVVARAGERIAVDGTVSSGESSVDQSPITGESIPVSKMKGSQVFAGTLNTDGALIIVTTKLASETTMARMVRLVAESQANAGRTQRFTERFTRIYSPVILAGVPLVIGGLMAFAGMPFEEAFLRAMAVLVGASPCALALSTPSAVIAGIGRAAQCGVLIKGGEHLEALGTVRAVAFDKTGTLTQGRPEVVAIVNLNEDGSSDTVELLSQSISPASGESPAGADSTGASPAGLSTESQLLLRTAHSLDQGALHPLAQAIVTAAAKQGCSAPRAQMLRAIPGRGLVGVADGLPVAIGSAGLFPQLTNEARRACDTLRERALSTAIVSRGDRLIGVIGLADQPRHAAAENLNSLRRLGVERTIMLTGDNEQVARNIGSIVGVDEVLANLTPEDKIAEVRKLLKVYGTVAFVGDGVNDAPALAAATVGIAMGASGTDVALEAADVALMSDDLSKLPLAVGLSRAARRIIAQNMAVSLGVVLVLIPLGVLGVTNLQWAVIGHEGSTVLVVFNALRLLAYPRD